jgi:alanine racemase
MTGVIRARIDTGALRHNLARIRALAPGAHVLAVIKANGYGHGLAAVARALSHADSLGVARLEEALVLRSAGIATKIVLMEGVFDGAQLERSAHAQLELVVHDASQLDMLERWRGEHRFVAWLKIDTGMNRLGFRPEQALAAAERLATLAVPARQLRLMTHLARADEADEPMTRAQVDRFAQIRRQIEQRLGPVVVSIGNSAGTLLGKDTRGDWVRPGLALYGVSPFQGSLGADFGLRPAMSFESTVIGVRSVLRDETVGYGGAWRAPRDSSVAILAVGYGDGVPRNLPNGTLVQVAGKPAPVVGRVSMDMLAVDVTDSGPVEVGAYAVLWGPDQPVERMAERAGTIPYELLCGLRARVPREEI